MKVLVSGHKYIAANCKENACCITHLQEVLHWLESRTSARLKRGVEGKQIA